VGVGRGKGIPGRLQLCLQLLWRVKAGEQEMIHHIQEPLIRSVTLHPSGLGHIGGWAGYLDRGKATTRRGSWDGAGARSFRFGPSTTGERDGRTCSRNTAIPHAHAHAPTAGETEELRRRSGILESYSGCMQPMPRCRLSLLACSIVRTDSARRVDGTSKPAHSHHARGSSRQSDGFQIGVTRA